MSITLLGHGIFNADASYNTTLPAVDTSGANLLLVALADFGGDTVTVSDSKSNAWTPVSAPFGHPRTRIVVATSPPTVGAGHTATTAGAATYGTAIALAAFSGALAAGALDQSAAGNYDSGGPATMQAGSVTPTQAGELCFAVLSWLDNVASVSINEGYTIISQVSWTTSPASHYGMAVAYKVQGAPAATNPTWTITTGSGTPQVSAALSTFKAAAGGLSPALRCLLTEDPMKNLVRQRDVTASQKETGIVLKSATTGLKLTGQLAANLSARYTREGQASVAITLVDLASYAAAYSSGGVHEDGATASYRFDFPDAVYATGSDGATFTDIVISGTNILDVEIHIDLTDYAPGTVDKTGYELDSTSLTAVAGAVLDVAASSHNTANSIGAKINAADATTLLDLANAIDTGLTPRQTLRLLAAAASGDVTISGNTVTITNPLTKAKTRITATTDTSGNRVVTATDLT